jgi:hypothetical protein
MKKHKLAPGRPSPRVSWWRDHALLDDVSEEVNELESKVVNELRVVQGSILRNSVSAE